MMMEKANLILKQFIIEGGLGKYDLAALNLISLNPEKVICFVLDKFKSQLMASKNIRTLETYLTSNYLI